MKKELLEKQNARIRREVQQHKDSKQAVEELLTQQKIIEALMQFKDSKHVLKELLTKDKILEILKQSENLDQAVLEIEKLESSYDTKRVVDILMNMYAAEQYCPVSDGSCNQNDCRECEREMLMAIVLSGLRQE